MLAVPAVTPVANAVVDPVAATDAPPLLLQVPPVVKSLRLILDPAHTDVPPPIPEGAEVTVSTMLALQPPDPA